jgi:integrase/recombinase XerD
VDVKLKYVWEDRDRHGNVRLYVKVAGRKKVRIRARPGTAEFMAAYQLALDGVTRQPRQSGRGSFGFVCRAYFASKVFKRLDPGTQSWRRNELEKICEKHGDKPIAMMKPEHIRALRDEKDTPDASNQRLKALRALFKWAVEYGEASNNPTLLVQRVAKAKTGGHHTWTPAEVKQFEDRHPIGSKARLAMALMLYTTSRREDATRFGPQHVRVVMARVGDREVPLKRIVYTQAKNEHRNPVHLDIPLHPELERIIAATPSGHLTFLATSSGKPFTPAGFGNWFRDRCNEAGLKHCSSHGLRKATATVLAERGATPHMIQSLTGHRTLHEVENYTRAARQALLADDAMKLLENENTPTAPRVTPTGAKSA